MNDNKNEMLKKFTIKKISSNKRNRKKFELSPNTTTITLSEPTNQSKKNFNIRKNKREKLNYKHLNNFFSQPKNYFDEVELHRKGLANNKFRQATKPMNDQMKGSEEKTEPGSYPNTTSPYPSAENYITDAEINSRGYLDRNYQIHYSIPILPKAVVNSINYAKRTEHIKREGELKNKRKENFVGMITCRVGDNDDHGKLYYQMYDDNRIYDLKCSDGRSVELSFSKKDAALVLHRHKVDDLSLT